jgi:8-oxo-dGTP pyrophosphatase MutT (NUDIX family)
VPDSPASIGPASLPWMEDVAARLRRRVPPPPEEPPLTAPRRAGVLVPLFVRDGALWVVLTQRTETVEHHRGQISFPGGGEEAEDESLLDTALRETEEEIGVAANDVRYLGRLSPIVTVTDFYVEPYVGAIPQPYVFRPAEAEIAQVIEAPVGALLDPRILETRAFPGRPEPVLFYHHGEHVIWGATARILKELLDALVG